MSLHTLGHFFFLSIKNTSVRNPHTHTHAWNERDQGSQLLILLQQPHERLENWVNIRVFMGIFLKTSRCQTFCGETTPNPRRCASPRLSFLPLGGLQELEDAPRRLASANPPPSSDRHVVSSASAQKGCVQLSCVCLFVECLESPPWQRVGSVRARVCVCSSKY